MAGVGVGVLVCCLVDVEEERPPVIPPETVPPPIPVPLAAVAPGLI